MSQNCNGDRWVKDLLDLAYCLVSHGSRDPRPQAAVDDLAQRLSRELDSPVTWGTLEFGSEPLAAQIDRVARKSQRLRIAPLFLSSGIHVCDDIPAQIAIARTGLADTISELAVLPHLGQAIDFVRAAWERLQKYPAVDAWVTVAHGSRRRGGNGEIETIAAGLERRLAVPHCVAYWSVEGQLVERIDQLRASGHRTIGLLPHFLFPGRLTDAIAATVATQQARSPELNLVCLETWSEAQTWTPRLIEWLK